MANEETMKSSSENVGNLHTNRAHLFEEIPPSRLEEIFDASPVGVGIVRISDGKILFINKEMAVIRGKNLDEDFRETLEGSSQNYWVNQHEFNETFAIFQKEGRLSTIEANLKRADDTPYPALTSWETVYLEKEKCIMYWVYDLSQLRETERALSETQTELFRKEQLETLGQLEVINEIAEELHRSTNVLTVAVKATESIQRYAGNPTAAISLLNEEKQTLELLYSSNSKPELDDLGRELPLSMSISGEAVRSKRIVVCEDLSLDTRVPQIINDALHEENYVSFISIPLIYQDKTLGVLNLLFRETYNVSDREKETLGALGKTIGLAILNATHVTQINEEIAERTILEAQLQQAQKIESIGQLAGGVAHDFNNLLVVISGYSQLILDNKNLPEVIRSYASEIVNAGDRAADLTGQLLTFGRRQAMNRAPVGLNDLLEGLEGMLSRLIPENIEQIFDIRPDLPNIFADRGHIEQVIVNLAVNARDAMPDGGRLSFHAECVELDDEFVRFYPDLEAGSHVLIRVSDSGTGMSPDIIEKIYEPFYTTKAEGEGTGLGLSVVFGIVGRHDGHIRVVSDLGVGSEFLVYLPTTQLTVDESKEANAVLSKNRSETILLVEDDVQVRDFAQKVLKLNGFTVLLAEDGESGIEQYERYHEQIDLIVSDVVMPNVGGRDMVERLSAKGYDVPVLFTSGYSPDTTHSDYLRKFGYSQIDKPYSPHSFIEKIEGILKSSRR